MTPESALRRAVESWNAGDLRSYLGLYAPGVRVHGYTPEPMGKAEVEGFYQEIWSGLAAKGRPGPELALDEVIADDTRAACRFVMRGVHGGPFMGAPSTGRAYALPGVTFLRFDGATCVERWSSADMLGLALHLGAVTPAG
jgi:predicted ester cyclase